MSRHGQFSGTIIHKGKEMTKLIYTIYSFSKKRLSVRKQARHQATTSALTLQAFPKSFLRFFCSKYAPGRDRIRW